MELREETTTLCWDCSKAVGECSWSRALVPVAGWWALPTCQWELTPHGLERMESFCVCSCPEFWPG